MEMFSINQTYRDTEKLDKFVEWVSGGYANDILFFTQLCIRRIREFDNVIRYPFEQNAIIVFILDIARVN
jgi:hypothetical protein